MEDHVVRTLEDGILTLRLNRPERLNAWNGAMRQSVQDAFQEANHDPAVKALILTGTGDRAFCAGQDLNEAKSFDAATADRWIEGFKDFYNTMRRFGKPYVVALNGLAAGSAFQVALLADYRVGHADSRMGQPEINSGILSITGFWIIREHLGLARATDLVLTGRLLPASECHHIGILNEIVDRGEVQARARAIAGELASKDAGAFRANKQWICAATQRAFDEAYEAARIAHTSAFEGGGPQKVMTKFLEG